jgi:hypothetical protein
MADYTLDDMLAEHMLAMAEHIEDPPLVAREPATPVPMPHASGSVAASRAGLRDDLAASGAHARASDPVESHRAAASISPNHLAASAAWVLGALQRIGPCSDAQLEAEGRRQNVRWEPQRLRSARAFLVDVSLVERVGTGKSPKGRDCAIWAVRP